MREIFVELLYVDGSFFGEILLIHMGGLGDVCLSESTFYSLTLQFGSKIAAVGVKRYLSLFSQYFVRVEEIQSLKWLFFFSDEKKDFIWERIIFIGKDRDGTLRKRLKAYSNERILFVDMYPEKEKIHVEDYQLRQLWEAKIDAKKKEVTPNFKPLVIFYPERSIKKKKWEYGKFLEVESILKKKNVPTVWLTQTDSPYALSKSLKIDDLADLKRFFIENGGILVSNDSGIAHLAAACGLYTVTIFLDTDPSIWHPRGRNVSLWEEKDLTPENVAKIVLDFFLPSSDSL